MNARIRYSASAAVVMASTLLVGVAAGDDDGKGGVVEIVPRWKAGETRTYERVKSRRRTRGGKEVSKGSGRGVVEVTVVEANEDGYLVRWSLGETKPDDPRAARDPMVREVSKIVDGMAVVLEVGRDASISGVRNWKELKGSADAMMDAMTRDPKAPGLDAAAMGKVREAVASMFATKEQIEQLFAREPQMFFVSSGRDYSPGRPIEYEDQLPNPWGAIPSPAAASSL